MAFKIESELIYKIINKPLSIRENEFDRIKEFFKDNSKGFMDIFEKSLRKIRNKHQIEHLFYLYQNLTDEINDISPFIAKEINRVLYIIIQARLYTKLVELNTLMENCGNKEIVTMLSEIVNHSDIYRYLSNLEIYHLKKVIHKLRIRLNKRRIDEIVLDMEITKNDLNWIDSIEL